MNLSQRVIMVTGAGGEIGAAIARGLASRGAYAIVADIAEGAGARTVREIEADGWQASFCLLDVTDSKAWEKAIHFAVSKFGRLDGLVNCAGLFAAPQNGLDDVTDEEWRRLHAVNLDGTFYGIRAARRAMAQQGGSIVNIGSVVAFFAARSGVAYGTSKGAIRGLTVQMAAACMAEGSNVRVNAVHPGYILTESSLAGGIRRLGSRAAAEKSFATRSPRNRILRPADIVGPVAFLLSDDAAMINGAELLVDDGLSTQMPGSRFDE